MANKQYGHEDVQERYRTLAKVRHPDAGGSVEGFKGLKEAAEAAIKYFAGILHANKLREVHHESHNHS